MFHYNFYLPEYMHLSDQTVQDKSFNDKRIVKCNFQKPLQLALVLPFMNGVFLVYTLEKEVIILSIYYTQVR